MSDRKGGSYVIQIVSICDEIIYNYTRVRSNESCKGIGANHKSE